MTTVQISQDIIEFSAPVRINPTNEWAASDYDVFSVGRQAGRGTGVYCVLYRRVNGTLLKAAETLKHLKIDNEGVWVSFDRKYSVAA